VAEGDVEVLHGGVANAGAVVRVGPHVLRPAGPHVESVHALLRHVRRNGFEGVPEPVGIEPDGRERLVFVEGDVPVPPYPAWAQADDVLASVAALLRRYHDATAGFAPPSGATWSEELGDAAGGPVLCHDDVCLENVVFRDGEAVALLDFDFAAPGRPEFDLATMARMCVPVDPDSSVFGFAPNDAATRLRVVADAYGLDANGRRRFLDLLDDGIRRSGEFVARRVAAGEQPFIDMWNKGGGQTRFDRRRAWYADERDRIGAALA
jgi:hypothetical protein